MGSFIQSKKKNPPQSKGCLSKGERKGWIDKSQYVAVPINTIKWESKKLRYTRPIDMGSQRSYHNLVTYQPFFIQKDSGEEVGYDYCYIYKFFAYSKLYNSYFKYIIRAEAYKDCFAIKFYCARQKHSEEKYSKILNAFNARETFQIFYCVASIIPQLLILHPGSSFCFMGASTLDKKGKIENKENNQRYRVYSEISRNLFGKDIFELRMSDNLSSGFFINKLSNQNIEEAEKRLVNYFYNIFNFEI